MNPFTGSSELALSDGLDRIRARAAACTPLPGLVHLDVAGQQPVVDVVRVHVRFTMILLASCLTCGSHDGFHIGLGTSVYCLFSW